MPKEQARRLGDHNRRLSPAPASANSLWRNGARTFFHDQRASKVGDILTVNVTISDSAQLSQRDGGQPHVVDQRIGFNNLFGLETVLASTPCRV